MMTARAKDETERAEIERTVAAILGALRTA
jgi:hypothetical protein